MPFRLLSLPMLFSLFAAVAQAQEAANKELLDAFEKLNAAFVAKDAKTISRYMADDHVAIISAGVRRTKSDDEKKLADYNMNSYKAEDVKVTMLGKDAALITYRAIIKGTFKGKPYSEKNYATATWVYRNGQWREFYYQETAARD